MSKDRPVPTMGAKDSPDAVYDARPLGVPKMGVFGLQHMFAMFGATVLVPALTGLSVSATLLFAGLGTLLFHFLAKGEGAGVPGFLVRVHRRLCGHRAERRGEPFALRVPGRRVCGPSVPGCCRRCSACSGPTGSCGLPAVVTGPIVICIGLILASSAITNASSNWLIAVVAIAVIVVCNIWGKGMVKIVPILLGVIVSYAVAAFAGEVDFSTVAAAPWVGLPVAWDNTVFSLFGETFDAGLAITAIITIMPLAFATMIEHIGDMSAISSTCNRNYIAEPGLHRTLLGDGLATIIASLFGAPANTTYGENTGVLALTKVFDPRVIRIAALFAIVFSFSPKFAALVAAMPACAVGGVSLVLYGMISAVGIRNLVENHVDFMKSRNVLITALILVLSLGIAYSAAGAIVLPVGRLHHLACRACRGAASRG